MTLSSSYLDEQTDTQLSKLESKSTSNPKLDSLNDEQMNSLGITQWNAQRIIPTPPQLNFMQPMFTESNTLPTSDQTTKSSNTYSSERSQLNNNNNHFSTLAISAIIISSLLAALLFTGKTVITDRSKKNINIKI